MINYNQLPKAISLETYGIKNAKVNYQLTPEQLHDITIEKGQGVKVSSGALAINTGEFTGRSPQDRFIVEDDITRDNVWWGNINIPIDTDKFDALYDKVTSYLSGKEIFVRDCYACADDDYQIHSVFGVAQPKEYPGVPTSVLSPRATLNNDEAYYTTAFKLTNAFRENFKKFEAFASEEIRRGGPQRYAF